MRILLPFLLLTLLGGCKIEVAAPPEGAVVNVDGSFRCEAGEVCAIEVADLIFNETFIAEPGPGYVFSQWHRRYRGLCGGSPRVCHLRTSGFSGNDALMALLQGDEWFYLSPEFAVAGPGMTPIADALLHVVDPDLRSCLQTATAGLNYAEELSRLACTGSRRGMQITNLQGLEQFSQLSWLNLSGNPLVGIEPLNILKNLVTLQLRDTGLSNIDSLASLGDLVVLDLQQNALSDISSLSQLTRLSRLQLSFNPLTGLDPLAQVDNLRELHLRGVPVTDITALAASNTRLRELDLTDTAISNLSIVEQLPALEQLSIGSAALENVHALATARLLQSLTVRIAPEMDAAVVLATLRSLNALTSLELDISESSVTSLADLDGMRALEHLHLSLANEQLASLQFLTRLEQLRDLSLSPAPAAFSEVARELTSLESLSLAGVADISFLSKYDQLQNLFLSNSSSNISVLADKTGLVRLGLIGNGIADVGSLAGLDSLEYLFLGSNGIVDINPLSGLEALQWLDLSYNRINELGIGLDGVAAGSILLNGNPLSCGSLEQYLSRKPEGVDLRFDTGCK